MAMAFESSFGECVGCLHGMISLLPIYESGDFSLFAPLFSSLCHPTLSGSEYKPLRCLCNDYTRKSGKKWQFNPVFMVKQGFNARVVAACPGRTGNFGPQVSVLFFWKNRSVTVLVS